MTGDLRGAMTYLQASIDVGGPEREVRLAAPLDRAPSGWGVVGVLGQPRRPVQPWGSAHGSPAGYRERTSACAGCLKGGVAAHRSVARGGGAARVTGGPGRGRGARGPASQTPTLTPLRCRSSAARRPPELRGSPRGRADVVITNRLRSVWTVGLPWRYHPFRPLSVMADDWVAGVVKRAPRRVPGVDPDAGGRLARESALFRELPGTGPTEVRPFTDLHVVYALSGQRCPWLLIDPKPYVGDPHYDVLQHLLNCNGLPRARADPIGLLASGRRSGRSERLTGPAMALRAISPGRALKPT